MSKKTVIFWLLAIIVILVVMIFIKNRRQNHQKINYTQYNTIIKEIEIYPPPYTIDRDDTNCERCLSFMKKNNIYEIIKMSNGDVLFMKEGRYNKLIGNGYMYTQNNTSKKNYDFITQKLEYPWYMIELY